MIGARFRSGTEANPDGAVLLELGPDEAEQLEYILNRAQVAGCCWGPPDHQVAGRAADQLSGAVGLARAAGVAK